MLPSSSTRRVGLAVGVVFAVLVLGMPHVAGPNPELYTAENCTEHRIVFHESVESPGELNYSEDGTGHYRNLTARQQAIVERMAQRPGELVDVNRSTYVAAAGENRFERGERDGIPHVIAYDGQVYRTGYRLDGCPIIEGVPVAFNPVVSFFLTLNFALTGPLAPVLVVGGALGGAWWVGRKIRY